MKNILTKSLLSFITIYASTFAFGQQANFEWAKSFGGIGVDEGRSITVDASGNVYTTGFFEGTVDFDPGIGTYNLTSVGGTDIFVQKLDASGNFLWAKAFGGNSDDKGASITVDAAGNIYSTGFFEGTVDFDPGIGTYNLTSVGGRDIFVQKLDASGNFLWAKAFGSSGLDVGNSITVDATGNIYTTGEFWYTVDFDPDAGTSNLTSAGGPDFFIQKLDASGNFLWAKAFGGTSFDIGVSITVDAAGNIYSTGKFEGTVDFDPGIGTYNLTSVGLADIFVQKLDASGNFLWAKAFGGNSGDIGVSITVDAAGNIYSTGNFHGTVDFDPGAGISNLTSAGAIDIFVQKLDASGNFLWAKAFGGTSYDIGVSITVDAAGNIYSTGNFHGTVDFDPGTGTYNLTSVSLADIFVQKLDASGNFLWAKAFGGYSDDTGISITVDASGNVYTTGSFQYIVDFDPGAGISNLSSAGSIDIFVQKISQCTANTGTDVITACDSYTWIDGNTYTESNNTATYTLTNVDGCDSVVTLDLTINTVDVSVVENGITLTANLAGASYQWIDCNDNNNPIAGETNQSYTATADGSYAVIVDDGNCVGTSICYAVIGVDAESIKETAVNIYPNPTNGLIFVKGEGIEKIVVTDVSGRVIEQVITSQQQVTLDLTGNVQGIYFVNIETKNGRIIRKILLK